MRRRLIVPLLLAGLIAACQPEAEAGPPQGTGHDFLVLALSWSPSYCEAEGADANRQQCDARKRHGFVVHGLWPQFESGWPEFCDSDEPRRVPDALVRRYLDIMPSAGLMGHQWRKHGSCTGLGQEDYFATVRAAYDEVEIPERFRDPAARMTLAPDEVEAAFIDANAGLAADGIAAICHDGRIVEVRICLTKELAPRSCPEIDARGCRLPSATMPSP